VKDRRSLGVLLDKQDGLVGVVEGSWDASFVLRSCCQL
jgi:hypothetical protein